MQLFCIFCDITNDRLEKFPAESLTSNLNHVFDIQRPILIINNRATHLVGRLRERTAIPVVLDEAVTSSIIDFLARAVILLQYHKKNKFMKFLFRSFMMKILIKYYN